MIIFACIEGWLDVHVWHGAFKWIFDDENLATASTPV